MRGTGEMMGVCMPKARAVEPQEMLETTGAGVEEIRADAEAMQIVEVYRQARDEYHEARARLTAAEASGGRLAVWMARKRCRAALRHFSWAGERLTAMTQTHPALIAKVMHTL